MKNSERLIAIIERMGQLNRLQGPLENADLSLAQFSVMACVARQPNSKVTEVAEKMGLSAPTVSVAIRKLEDGDWIERHSDPDDARSALVSLSKRGKSIMENMNRHRNKKVNQFLGHLNADEQEQLLSLLEKASGAKQLETSK